MTKTRKHPIEENFSRAFRDSFDGWIERIEKGRGTTDGMPDLVCLMPSGFEMVEVKVGSIVDGVLWTEEVRPSQIRLHTDLANHGGRSIFVVGCWVGGENPRFDDPDNWRCFAFDGVIARHWSETGFKIGEVAFELDMSDLKQSLADFIYDQMEK